VASLRGRRVFPVEVVKLESVVSQDPFCGFYVMSVVSEHQHLRFARKVTQGTKSCASTRVVKRHQDVVQDHRARFVCALRWLTSKSCDEQESIFSDD
jgi:short subunit dehydrogenase-like uncharacterized protein